MEPDFRLVPLILYFFVYSFIGYLIEIVFCSISEKKLVNRGFLFGPILPIYGTGMCLVLLSTREVQDDLVLTFLTAMAVCSATEYLVSWVMEKLFGIKWWDYSEQYRFHLNGRICLTNSLAFGIGGLLVVKQIHPGIMELVAKIPHPEVVAWVLVGLLLIDTIASNYAVAKVKNSWALKHISGDQTNEIKKLARRAIAQLVTGKNFLEQKIDETKQSVKKSVEAKKKSAEKSMKKRKKNFQKKIEKLKR